MENKLKIETNVVKPGLVVFEKESESEHRVISIEDENSLDQKIEDIENFMLNNSGKGMSTADNDDLYLRAQGIWNEYATHLRDVKYCFYLNRRQFQFLRTLLTEKLEYDVDTLFFAMDLSTLLGNWTLEKNKSKDDNDLTGRYVDATEITFIYHLIKKHKVKGLTNDAYLFAEVLRRIGGISKIISYYDTAAKNLSVTIQEWVASFEDGVLIDGKDFGKDIESAKAEAVVKDLIKTKKKVVKKEEITE